MTWFIYLYKDRSPPRDRPQAAQIVEFPAEFFFAENVPEKFGQTEQWHFPQHLCSDDCLEGMMSDY